MSDTDLPDPVQKKRQLRQRVQELETEVERLRSEVRSAYTMLDRYANEVSDEAYHEVESCLIGALNGGGDDG